MKKVLNVSILITIFAIILRANTMDGRVNFEIGVCIFLLSFLASTVIVTISEVIKLDRTVEQDHNNFLTHKTTRMTDQSDSLDD